MSKREQHEFNSNFDSCLVLVIMRILGLILCAVIPEDWKNAAGQVFLIVTIVAVAIAYERA